MRSHDHVAATQEAVEDPERNIFVIDHASALLSTLTKSSKTSIIEQINNQPGWNVSAVLLFLCTNASMHASLCVQLVTRT